MKYKVWDIVQWNSWPNTYIFEIKIIKICWDYIEYIDNDWDWWEEDKLTLYSK